ncbi:MAG TPA: DoxX family protein [Burkholderiales bacterium]|nr:DoxX family protein [Burkholderiales bacterium]
MSVGNPLYRLTTIIDAVAPAFDLLVRLYVAEVFFRSGLVKIKSLDATLALFENEYAVPLLPYELAAYVGTAIELVVPVFLVLGLGARAAALLLFVFNAIAVISYPDISAAGIKDHMLWGFLLAAIFFHGPGNWSLDRFLLGRMQRRGAQPRAVSIAK